VATTKSRAKKSPARKSGKRSTARSSVSRSRSSKQRSSSKKPALIIDSHRFQIGDEVTIHHPQQVEAEQRIGREPIGAPLEKTKVRKDGAIHLGVEPGTYVVAGPSGDERKGGSPRYLYLTVLVP
jgi:hypothetical protein